ncbi:ComF family protein [Chitinibacter sp. GC72]|uniref:ComF family protein n=1 Tax=Chitinibacter sp. GC72 TaxID=1526917 RepID=UPI0012F855F6|nr:ComF family protein [Chitinibacter sp. GC72]
MSNLFSRFLNNYIPAQCLVCRGLLNQAQSTVANSAICQACQQALPRWQAAESCPRCARPDTQGHVCGACLRKPPAFDQTLALYLFVEPLQSMIHAAKFARQWAIFPALAGQLDTEARLNELVRLNADFMLPLPLHRQRLRERGFNQSLEIARTISQLSGIALRRELLLRVRDTEHQSRLSAQARWKNLRGAFECKTDCSGKIIIVVDDVMTSGASLQAAAKALKQAGAARVINLVLARTPFK